MPKLIISRALHLEPVEPESKHGSREEQSRRRHSDGEFDTTDLNSKSHGRGVHRDYAAHYFRWGWAANFCSKKKVIDYGCGKEQPLARVLTDFNYPELYLGADLNKIDQWNAPWKNSMPNVDLCDSKTVQKILDEYGQFEVGVSFEVIEHVPVNLQETYLTNLAKCIADDGVVLLSTPIYSPGKGMAKNHVSELLASELERLIGQCGLSVAKRYGTFADYSAWKKALKNRLSPQSWIEVSEIIEEIGEFYSTTVQSNWWAPAFPDACRNNAWVLTKN